MASAQLIERALSRLLLGRLLRGALALGHQPVVQAALDPEPAAVAGPVLGRDLVLRQRPPLTLEELLKRTLGVLLGGVVVHVAAELVANEPVHGLEVAVEVQGGDDGLVGGRRG